MLPRLLAASLGLASLAHVQVVQASPVARDLIGKPAPAFTLTSDDDEQVSLADFKGKPVVLAFFPKAFTPG